MKNKIKEFLIRNMPVISGVGILLVAGMLLLLSGCSPQPMGEEGAKAFKACIDKGWVPRYFSNGGQIDFTCLPRDTDK
jgi:hypothetical protein